MHRSCMSSVVLFVLGVSGLFTGGCGGPAGPAPVMVRGEVTNNGEPLKVKPMVGRVQVTFFPLNEAGEPAGDRAEAAVLPNGEFTVHGSNGKGIPPGKYKIAVRQWDEFPTKDVLQGKCDEKNSKIIREVKGGEDIIIIDVKDILTGTGTAK